MVKKIFFSMIFIILIIVGALFIAPSFIDWNKYKEKILEQASAKTGLEIKVDGNLQFTVLPYPSLVMDNVTISPYDKNLKKDNIITIDMLGVNVGMIKLLSGEIEIKTIDLANPNIKILIDENGQIPFVKNFSEKKQEDKSKKGKTSDLISSLSIDSINILGGTLHYKNLSKKNNFNINDIDISLSVDSITGPFSIDGSLSYANEKIDIQAKLGDFSKDKTIVPLNADISLPNNDTKISYSGIISMDKPYEVQGEIKLKSTNLQKSLFEILPKISLSLPDKSIDMEAMLTITEEMAAIRNSVIKYGNSSILEGQAEIKNFKNPEISIYMNANKGIKIDDFLPNATDKTSKNNGDFLLPSSFEIPYYPKIDIEINARDIKYKSLSGQKLYLKIKKEEKNTEFIIKAEGFDGNSNIDIDGELEFKSNTKGKEYTVLADPELSFSTVISSDNPEIIISAFGYDISKYSPLIAKSRIDGKVKLTPRTLSIKDSNISFSDFTIANQIDYKINKNKRDKLDIKLGANIFDADLLKIKLGTKEDNTKTKITAESLKNTLIEMVEKVPFDVSFSASADRIIYDRRDIMDSAIMAKITNNSFAINAASVKDIYGAEISMAFAVDDIKDKGKINSSISFKTDNLNNFTNVVGLEEYTGKSELGEAKIDVILKGDYETLSIISNSSILAGSAAISSKLLNLKELSFLKANITHPNLLRAIKIIAPDYNGTKAMKSPVNLYFELHNDGETYSFKAIEGKIAGTAIKGNIDYKKGKIPEISANISLGDVSLNDYLGKASEEKSVRWSRSAIDVEWMHKFNMDLKTFAKTLSYDNWKINDFAMEASLKNGKFEIAKMDGEMFGGRTSISSSITSYKDNKKPIDIIFKSQMNNVQASKLSKALGMQGLIRAKAGSISMTTDLNASGISPSAMILSLEGKSIIEGENIFITGFDIGKITRGLTKKGKSGIEKILSGGARAFQSTISGGETKFSKISGSFDIKNGIAETKDTQLQATDALVDITGTINLPQWLVDAKTIVTLYTQEDKPQLEWSFKGSLDNPVADLKKEAMENFLQNSLKGLISGQNPEDAIKGAIDNLIAPKPSNDNTDTSPTNQKPLSPEDAFKDMLNDWIIKGDSN